MWRNNDARESHYTYESFGARKQLFWSVGVDFFEVEGQQIADVGILAALRHFAEHMAQPRQRLDPTSAAGQHEAVDHGAGLGT